MQITELYVYKQDGKGTVVSEEKPDCKYSITLKITADEGKVMVNKNNPRKKFKTILVRSKSGWIEEEGEPTL